MYTKIRDEKSEGNLVERFNLGNTQIEIYNNAYKNNTKEDIDIILRRIAHIVRNEINNGRAKTSHVEAVASIEKK